MNWPETSSDQPLRQDSEPEDSSKNRQWPPFLSIPPFIPVRLGVRGKEDGSKSEKDTTTKVEHSPPMKGNKDPDQRDYWKKPESGVPVGQQMTSHYSPSVIGSGRQSTKGMEWNSQFQNATTHPLIIPLRSQVGDNQWPATSASAESLISAETPKPSSSYQRSTENIGDSSKQKSTSFINNSSVDLSLIPGFIHQREESLRQMKNPETSNIHQQSMWLESEETPTFLTSSTDTGTLSQKCLIAHCEGWVY
jgi:hypothetical protein